MTYAKKFGKYGIYADNMLYEWFKVLENAEAVWNEKFANPGCAAEWLEEYDEIKLVDMKNGKIIHIISA